jgi:hypothetical protein
MVRGTPERVVRPAERDKREPAAHAMAAVMPLLDRFATRAIATRS